MRRIVEGLLHSSQSSRAPDMAAVKESAHGRVGGVEGRDVGSGVRYELGG